MRAYVPNPCTPAGRKPVELITDRAKRYRANQCPPPGPRQCAYCGARRNVEVEHVSGDEADASPANLTWACRSCNTKKGAAFKRAGLGKLTRQYNPSPKASAGARSLGQWLQAVLSAKGEGSMKIQDAVAMIRATPPARRSEFASEIWARRKERGTDRREEVPF